MLAASWPVNIPFAYGLVHSSDVHQLKEYVLPVYSHLTIQLICFCILGWFPTRQNEEQLHFLVWRSLRVSHHHTTKWRGWLFLMLSSMFNVYPGYAYSCDIISRHPLMAFWVMHQGSEAASRTQILFTGPALVWGRMEPLRYHQGMLPSLYFYSDIFSCFNLSSNWIRITFFNYLIFFSAEYSVKIYSG